MGSGLPLDSAASCFSASACTWLQSPLCRAAAIEARSGSNTVSRSDWADSLAREAISAKPGWRLPSPATGCSCASSAAFSLALSQATGSPASMKPGASCSSAFCRSSPAVSAATREPLFCEACSTVLIASVTSLNRALSTRTRVSPRSIQPGFFASFGFISVSSAREKPCSPPTLSANSPFWMLWMMTPPSRRLSARSTLSWKSVLAVAWTGLSCGHLRLSSGVTIQTPFQ